MENTRGARLERLIDSYDSTIQHNKRFLCRKNVNRLCNMYAEWIYNYPLLLCHNDETCFLTGPSRREKYKEKKTCTICERRQTGFHFDFYKFFFPIKSHYNAADVTNHEIHDRITFFFFIPGIRNTVNIILLSWNTEALWKLTHNSQNSNLYICISYGTILLCYWKKTNVYYTVQKTLFVATKKIPQVNIFDNIACDFCCNINKRAINILNRLVVLMLKIVWK